VGKNGNGGNKNAPKVKIATNPAERCTGAEKISYFHKTPP
jgi:hypothetical protein